MENQEFENPFSDFFCKVDKRIERTSFLTPEEPPRKASAPQVKRKSDERVDERSDKKKQTRIGDVITPAPVVEKTIISELAREIGTVDALKAKSRLADRKVADTWKEVKEHYLYILKRSYDDVKHQIKGAPLNFKEIGLKYELKKYEYVSGTSPEDLIKGLIPLFYFIFPSRKLSFPESIIQKRDSFHYKIEEVFNSVIVDASEKEKEIAYDLMIACCSGTDEDLTDFTVSRDRSQNCTDWMYHLQKLWEDFLPEVKSRCMHRRSYGDVMKEIAMIGNRDEAELKMIFRYFIVFTCMFGVSFSFVSNTLCDATMDLADQYKFHLVYEEVSKRVFMQHDWVKWSIKSCMILFMGEQEEK
jgi:hypothetical protein